MSKARIINEYGGHGDERGEHILLVPKKWEKVKETKKSHPKTKLKKTKKLRRKFRMGRRTWIIKI
jgi:hypothetical protein